MHKLNCNMMYISKNLWHTTATATTKIQLDATGEDIGCKSQEAACSGCVFLPVLVSLHVCEMCANSQMFGPNYRL